MPLYEYRCESCDHQFEVIQKFSDAPIAVCPKCGGGPVVKLLSSPAFQFKGSGWYITDYARKDKGGAGGSSSKDGEKSAEAKPADAKAAESSSTPAPAGPPKAES
jgi:putative FmdB family regulatory protein